MEASIRTGICFLALGVLGTVGHAQTPVWGFADLHSHPASFLGFGADDQYGENGLMWGKPAHDFAHSGGCSPGITLGCTGGLDRSTSDLNLDSDLPPCTYSSFPGVGSGFSHNNRAGGDPVTIGTDTQIVSQLDNTSPGWTHEAGGYPNFSTDNAHGWQAALTVDHQLMHIDNIYRAYQGGLRLMFASAVDDEVLSKLWTQGLGAAKPFHDPDFDNNSAAKQLTYITNLASANNTWMQIVKTPREARTAINNNKLAVVLSLEMDSLSLPQIQVLVQQFGVAHVIPVHLADNPAFGGTALYSDIFNGLSNFINNGSPENGKQDSNVSFALSTQVQTLQLFSLGGFSGPLGWAPTPSDPTPGPVQVPGQINTRDLNVPDFLALMEMGLLLDIAHMGQTTASTALRLGLQYNYPLMDSHTGLRCDSPNPSSGFPAVSCQTRYGKIQGPVSTGLSGADQAPNQSCGSPNPPVALATLVNERNLPISQLAIIKKLGGVIGLGEVPHGFQGAQQAQINCTTTASTPFVVPDQTRAGPSVGPAAWVYFQGTGGNQLWKVRADGTQQSQIGCPANCNTTASTPFVVPDPTSGHNWVYFQGTGGNQLWKVRDDGSDLAQIGCPANCLTTASTPFVVPDPTSGHNWVYFQGNDDKLWKVRDDGSPPSNIGANTTASAPFVVPDPTSGHNWVYFQGNGNFGTGNQLWKVRDDGTGQEQIGCNQGNCNTTASTPFVTPPGSDGHSWVYFQGTGNTFRSGNQLWKVRDDGTGQEQIGCNQGNCNTTASTPFVVPDPNGGPNWVYFQGTNGNALWMVRDDGTLQTQLGGNTTASRPFVTPDRWVYFQGTSNLTSQGNALWEAPSVLVDPDPVTTWINGYAQALDLMGGKRVALGTDTNGLSPLIQQDVIPTQYPFTLNFCPPSPTTCLPQQLNQYTFGSRTFNFQTDGIANYGMLPDFIQAASQSRIGFMNGSVAPTAQIAALFNSAEDTIEMWEAAENVVPTLSDYDQTATGILTVDISSATEYGRVTSARTVIVGGTLNIALQNGFVPSVGQTFVIMTAPLVTGTFGTVKGIGINAGEQFVVQYSDTSIVLQVLPL
jgi:hypothetical protein